MEGTDKDGLQTEKEEGDRWLKVDSLSEMPEKSLGDWHTEAEMLNRLESAAGDRQ